MGVETISEHEIKTKAVVVLEFIDLINDTHGSTVHSIDFEVAQPEVLNKMMKKAIDRAIKDYMIIEDSTTKIEDFLS